MRQVQSLAEFAEMVEHGQHVFYFTADWCGDCRFIKPALPEIEAAFPQYTFVEVNRDDYIEVCQTWNILGIPSFVVVKDGEEKGRLVNKLRKTKAEVMEFLEKTLKEG